MNLNEIICSCGCGKKIIEKPYRAKKHKSLQKFINGHNMRGIQRPDVALRDVKIFRGKTYKEISGENKAKIHIMNLSKIRKGKTYEKIFGIKQARVERKKRSDARRGKTYEQLFGVNKAKQLKLLRGQIRRITNIKMRKQNYGISCPAYNKIACEFFKSFDDLHNTKGRYAMYGGGEFLIEQLGYFPDYINFDKKIIMEWDEPIHFDKKGRLKEKDLKRQREIQEKYPDFEFRRIKE